MNKQIFNEIASLIRFLRFLEKTKNYSWHYVVMVNRYNRNHETIIINDYVYKNEKNCQFENLNEEVKKIYDRFYVRGPFNQNNNEVFDWSLLLISTTDSGWNPYKLIERQYFPERKFEDVISSIKKIIELELAQKELSSI